VEGPTAAPELWSDNYVVTSPMKQNWQTSGTASPAFLQIKSCPAAAP